MLNCSKLLLGEKVVNRMKISIVVPVLITGGAETMATRLAIALKKTNNDVCVISMYPRQNSSLEQLLEKQNIKIYYLGKNKHGSKKALFDLFNLLSEINPDVVHSHIYATFYAIPWILVHSGKLVHTIHTKPEQEFSKRNSKLLKWLVKLNKMLLVAVSSENQRLAMEFYGIDESKVRCVNNPVDTKLYYHDSKPKNKFVYINVSRQDANKNQILAIRALKNVLNDVENAQLVLVGNGTHHSMLEEEAKKLGVQKKVFFAGERSDIPDILSTADVYISTSHREGLPLSILEAMAAELPVIATNVGGCSDIVRENGILISDDDQSALENAMIKLAKNPHIRKKMGDVSKRMAFEYDADTCAQKYMEVYKEAVGKRRKV